MQQGPVLNSRQYAIWTELVKIMNVEPETLEGVKIPSVSPTVVPTIDVLTGLAFASTRTDSITASAVDTKEIYVVPEDEYHMVYRMSLTRASGDRDLDHVQLEGGGGRLVLDNTNVSAVDGLAERVVPMPVALLLRPGDAVLIRDSGGTTNSAWSLFTWRREFPILT